MHSKRNVLLSMQQSKEHTEVGRLQACWCVSNTKIQLKIYIGTREANDGLLVVVRPKIKG